MGKEIAKQRTRTELVKKLSGMGLCREEIVQKIQEAWGMDIAVASLLYEDAASEMLEYVGKTKAELLADSVQWWFHILKDPEGEYSIAQQAAARKQLDKILGLDDNKPVSGAGTYMNFENVQIGQLEKGQLDVVEGLLAGDTEVKQISVMDEEDSV